MGSRKFKAPTIYVLGLVIILGIIFGQILKNRVFFSSTVIGDSMKPTYEDGDIVCVNKLETVSQGDVLAIDDGKWIIKRCIATPGDTIQIIDSVVYINDVEYKEDYLYSTEPYESGIAKNKITLGKDEYFVMGDNRQVSKDSRIIGVINKKQILGVVIN